MKRFVVAVLVALSLFVPSTASAKIVSDYPPLPKGITPVDLGGGIQLLYYRFVTDSLGEYHVIGEVENTNDVAIASPGLAFTLTSADGNIDGVVSAFPVLYQIPPQSRMPFEGFATSDVAAGAMTKDQATPSACLSDSSPFDDTALSLAISNVHETANDLAQGKYKVTGRLHNNGDSTVQNVGVIALLFDQSGRFAGSITPTAYPPIPAGKSASFTLDDGYDSFRTDDPLSRVRHSVTTVLKAGHLVNAYMSCQG